MRSAGQTTESDYVLIEAIVLFSGLMVLAIPASVRFRCSTFRKKSLAALSPGRDGPPAPQGPRTARRMPIGAHVNICALQGDRRLRAWMLLTACRSISLDPCGNRWY